MSHRIDWSHDNRQPIVSVSVLAPEPLTHFTEREVPALIDTGSTTSGITRRIADELSLVGIGKRPLVSARNEDQVERYIFRLGLRSSIELGGPTFPYTFAAVIGFELRAGFKFEALIGMDILSQCDLALTRTGHCSLSFG